MKVLFLHGLESKPGGSKAVYLSDKGYEVLNPALPKSSFPESIAIAQQVIDDEDPDVIVGSSRGGAVAMSVDPRGARLVLVAPAWRNYGVPPTVPSNTIVIHSPLDAIIPVDDSREIEGAQAVVPVGEDHRMFDQEALSAIGRAVQGDY
tara:strand:+ start:1485 stop:1931 length:447 start_codon:yes stop_codon:yes gene_type:complete